MRFHTPKNLAMALASEAGELLTVFQWLTPAESATVMTSNRAGAVRDELADVFIDLVRLCDVLKIDIASEATAKVTRNTERFPVREVRGRRDRFD